MRRADDSGASLIFALILMGAVALLMLVLGSQASDNLASTASLQGTRATEYAAEGAAEAAIQAVRYTATTFATAGYCTPGGTHAVSGIEVYCTGPANGSEPSVRTITFFACPAGEAPDGATPSCTASPILEANVTFLDFRSNGSYDCASPTFVTCGSAMTVNSWVVYSAGNNLVVNPTGPATQLVVTQQPANATGGSAFPNAVAVAVEDANGNRVTTDTSAVTLAISTNPGSGTLSCPSNPVTASSGVATFSGCSIDKVGTGYVLKATDGSLTAATSGAFNVTAGAAAKLVVTQQPANATGGSAFPNAVAVTVEDANGNPVTTDTSAVTLAISTNPGSGTLSCPSNPVTASSGLATFSGCSIDKVGTGYVLKATDGSLTAATSGAFNVTTGAAAKLAFTSSPGNSAAGSVFAAQPAVAVEDAGGNIVSTDGSTVTLSISTNPGSGTLSCTANPKAAAGGTASFAGCRINNSGTGYVLQASDSTLAPATSPAFTIDALPTISTPNSGSQEKVSHNGVATFTIAGTGFANGAVVSFSGGFTVNSSSVQSATSLSVTVTAGSGNQKGTWSLTVTNPDGGRATSVNSMVVS